MLCYTEYYLNVNVFCRNHRVFEGSIFKKIGTTATDVTQAPNIQTQIRYTAHSRYIAMIFHCITHETHPITRPEGRGIGCRSWVQIWPKIYNSNCFAVSTIVSYITAIYWESILLIWLWEVVGFVEKLIEANNTKEQRYALPTLCAGNPPVNGGLAQKGPAIRKLNSFYEQGWDLSVYINIGEAVDYISFAIGKCI